MTIFARVGSFEEWARHRPFDRSGECDASLVGGENRCLGVRDQLGRMRRSCRSSVSIAFVPGDACQLARKTGLGG